MPTRIHSTEAEDTEDMINGVDFNVLLDALNARDRMDSTELRRAVPDSPIYRHHQARLRASGIAREKLLRSGSAVFAAGEPSAA